MSGDPIVADFILPRTQSFIQLGTIKASTAIIDNLIGGTGSGSSLPIKTTNTTQSTSTSTGALIIEGGAGIANDLNVGG